MDNSLHLRILKEAEHIASTGDTLRKTAKLMGISKSTVHKDMSKRLKGIDKELYEEVRNVVENNKSLRHIRGGEATKERYLRLKECREE